MVKRLLFSIVFAIVFSAASYLAVNERKNNTCDMCSEVTHIEYGFPIKFAHHDETVSLRRACLPVICGDLFGIETHNGIMALADDRGYQEIFFNPAKMILNTVIWFLILLVGVNLGVFVKKKFKKS